MLQQYPAGVYEYKCEQHLSLKHGEIRSYAAREVEIQDHDDAEITTYLNTMASQGWELFQVVSPQVLENIFDTMLYYWRRETA